MVSCSYCLRLLVDPVSFVCGHNFCVRCKGELLTDNAGDPICAACGTVCHEDPEVSADVVETVEQLSRGCNTNLCGRCEVENAMLMCVPCNMGYCQQCSDLIHVGRLKTHEVNNLDDTTKLVPPCSEHPSHPLVLHCTNCETRVCVKCLVGGMHQGHNVVSSDSTENHQEKQLESLVQQVSAIQRSFSPAGTRSVHAAACARIEKYCQRALDIVKQSEEAEAERWYSYSKKLEPKFDVVNRTVTSAMYNEGDLSVLMENLDESLQELTDTLHSCGLGQETVTGIRVNEMVVTIQRGVSRTLFPNLVVKDLVELDAWEEEPYKFSDVIVYSGGNLTCKGHKLLLLCERVHVHPGGIITMTGKGAVGGRPQLEATGDGAAQQGGDGLDGAEGDLSSVANGGGGGGGVAHHTYGSTGGGGGGYGTPGEDGHVNTYRGGYHPGGAGGGVYGNSELTTLSKGSGGGAGHQFTEGTGGKGGNGGGCIHISCSKEMIVEGDILCDGQDGGNGTKYGSGGGGGSGGSIKLESANVVTTGKVSAKGGQGGTTCEEVAGYENLCSAGGRGGIGRVCIISAAGIIHHDTGSNGLITPRVL